MKERRYKEDYGLETRIDDRGREKREAVYRGEWFRLDDGDAKKLKVWSCVCAAAFAAFYLLYLEWNTPSTRCMYVFPIAACALAPLAYWLMGLWTMLRAPEKMTRVQKEKGVGRVLRSCVACGVLIAMACAGDAVYMLAVLKRDAGAEWIGFVFMACAAAAAFGCFARVRDAYNHIHTLGKAGEKAK